MLKGCVPSVLVRRDPVGAEELQLDEGSLTLETAALCLMIRATVGWLERRLS